MAKSEPLSELTVLPRYEHATLGGRVVHRVGVHEGAMALQLVLHAADGKDYDATHLAAASVGTTPNPYIALDSVQPAAIRHCTELAQHQVNFACVNAENEARLAGCYNDMKLNSLGEEFARLLLEAGFRTKLNTSLPSWLRVGTSRRELDGYAPESHLAFEYQGAHHAEAHVATVDLHKQRLCQERGVRLLQVGHEDQAIARYLQEPNEAERNRGYGRLLIRMTSKLNTAIARHPGLPVLRLTPAELLDVKDKFDKMAESKRGRMPELATAKFHER